MTDAERLEHEESLRAVGANIAAARSARGMRSMDLAIAVGVSKQAVSMWEHGRALPRLATLLRVAAALGVDPSELVRLA